MKNNKKVFLWIAGAAAVVLLILLLSMCTGKKPVDSQTEESHMDILLADEEETQATQTTAPEETAEATEDTEPAEETQPEETESTTPSSGGSANPGGSGGYNPIDDDYDDGTGGQTTEVKVPAAGSEGNPYLEMLRDYPGSITSVKLSSDGAAHYLLSGSAGCIITIENPDAQIVCGETTYKPDESGVLTLDLSETTSDAVILLSNTGKEKNNFVLKFVEAPGGKTNPLVLADIRQFDVSLKAEDMNGCYYLWNAVTTGQLTLTPEKEGLEIVISIGENLYKLSESKDGTVSCPIVKGEDVLIQVVALPDGEGKYPEIQMAVTGQVDADPGTEENPLPQTLAELPGSFTTGEIPAGGQVFYSVSGIRGAIATLESADAALLYGETVVLPDEAHVITLALPSDGEEPILLGVENRGTESAVFELKFAMPLGTEGNPAALESIDTVEVSLAAGSRDGYWFRWTAEEDGTVQFSVTESAPEGVGCDVDLRKAGAETQALLSDSEDESLCLDVSAGDTLLLHVTALPDGEGNYPEAQVKLYGTFVSMPGTEGNPILISDPAKTQTITVEADKTVYFSGFFHEMTMTIPNAGNASVTFAEETYKADKGTILVEFPQASGMGKPTPQTFALHSKTEKTYSLTFAFPVGHQQNPAALVLGSNTAEVKENADGFFFTWTAASGGELTITVDPEEPWQYVINNLTASRYGDTRTSEASANTETVAVSAGDVLQLIVNTYNPEDMFSTPEGSVTFTASFVDPLLGTEEKPIALAEKDSFTVPAGKTVYYTGGAEGMVMTLKGSVQSVSCGGTEQMPVDGVLSLTCVGAKPVFAITGGAEEDAVCTVSFAYPLGHAKNPAQLVLGSNRAELKENADGFFFTWTAACSGELTITMDPEEPWQYVINNLTASRYGDTRTSGDSANTETVAVSAGDELQLMVNTFDPEDLSGTPEGSLTFTASFFDPLLGTEEKPIALAEKDSFTVPAGKTVYYTGGAEGMVMTLKGSVQSVSCGGTEHMPVDGVVSLTCVGAKPVFAITGDAEEDVLCTVSFAYPVGHAENPAKLVLGSNEIELDANADGYTFAWTADKSGKLTITMDSESNWQFTLCSETQKTEAEPVTSEEKEKPYSCTISVAKSDRILITVNTFDPSTPGVTPAGKVAFTAGFSETLVNTGKETLALSEGESPEENAEKPEENTDDAQSGET